MPMKRIVIIPVRLLWGRGGWGDMAMERHTPWVAVWMAAHWRESAKMGKVIWCDMPGDLMMTMNHLR